MDKTVHIKKPYSDLISANHIHGLKSTLGSEYLCYENTDILLDGLNGNSIIELKRNNLKLRTSIPNDYIIYTPYQTSQHTCVFDVIKIRG